MTNAVVVYTILTIAVVFLLLSSPRKSCNGHRHLRLNGHLVGVKALNFDPLITKIEHETETKSSDYITNVDYDLHDNPTLIENVQELVEAEVEKGHEIMYFGNHRKLNLALRLKFLFPFIDNLPKDGFVGLRELEDWNIKQANERLMYTTRKEFGVYDKNRDGLISFEEYLPRFSDEDIKKNEMAHGKAGWWSEQFRNADVDHNGELNLTEFKNFLHPEDCKDNNQVEDWLMREKTRRMDWNNDGMLSLQEFHDNAYDTFRTYYQFIHGADHVPSPEQQFAELDSDKDRFLSIHELKHIRNLLFPGELENASYYAIYLITEVDDDHDGQLTIQEMLNHVDKFYRSVYVGNEEYEDDYHDEF